MICPECNGRGETIYYVETHRDENSVTVEQRKGICLICNGSGEKHMTNADRIRATDDELAIMLHAVKMGYKPWCDYHCENEGDDGCDNCIKKWLQQPAEET